MRAGGVAVSSRGPAAAAASELKARDVEFAAVNRADPARLTELTALLDGGQLRVPPLKTFELDQAGKALAEMAAGHVRGKLVITLRQS